MIVNKSDGIHKTKCMVLSPTYIFLSIIDIFHETNHSYFLKKYNIKSRDEYIFIYLCVSKLKPYLSKTVIIFVYRFYNFLPHFFLRLEIVIFRIVSWKRMPNYLILSHLLQSLLHLLTAGIPS